MITDELRKELENIAKPLERKASLTPLLEVLKDKSQQKLMLTVYRIRMIYIGSWSIVRI